MLKAATNTKLDWLDKLIPQSLIKRFMLNLPFKHIEKGRLTLNMFGQSHQFVGELPGHQVELTIVHPAKSYWLLSTQGELGFAQAYMDGVIETNSLYQVMHLAYENSHVFDGLFKPKTINLLKLWQHRKSHNSLENSRKNISFHYDLGNAFYEKWLDDTMSYSSAIFNEDTHTLESAQQAKYQRLIDLLAIDENSKVLEIGCGWGGFMENALAQGAQIKGLTLSTEQQLYAQKRLANQSNPYYEVALQDYRHENSQYDFIVSIEMFEAVGKEYWQQYFTQLNSCLKPGGKAALQIITIDEKHSEKYQNSVDFIQAYIFPGGLLPSVSQVTNLVEDFGFAVEDIFEFGQDYGVTCQLWKHAFNRQSEALAQMGYDQRFQKLWNYYLDYCTVGFETNHISVHQFILSKPLAERGES